MSAQDRGFSPFFGLAAIAAVVQMLLWLNVLTGTVQLQQTIDPRALHYHEAIFAFTLPVVLGALHCTGAAKMGGKALAGLALLWLLGRATIMVGPSALKVAAVVNGAFPVAVAAVLAGPMLRSGRRGDLGILALLLVLAGAEVVLFAELLGRIGGRRSSAQWIGLVAVTVMVVMVAGRVVRAAAKDAGREIRGENVLDLLAPWSIAALIPLYAARLSPKVLGAALIVVGVINLARMFGWGSMAEARRPSIAVLHLGYVAVAVAFLLEGPASFTRHVGEHPGRHVLGIAGLGLVSLGLMTRGAERALPKGTTVIYALLVVSVLLRFGAILIGSIEMPLLWGSTGCYVACFIGYLVLYGRHLMGGSASASAA